MNRILVCKLLVSAALLLMAACKSSPAATAPVTPASAPVATVEPALAEAQPPPLDFDPEREQCGGAVGNLPPGATIQCKPEHMAEITPAVRKRVVVSRPVVVGKIKPVIVESTIVRYRTRYAWCADKATPPASGTATLAIAVDAEDKLMSIDVSGLGAPEVEACIARVTQDARFGRIARPEPYTFTVTVTIGPP